MATRGSQKVSKAALVAKAVDKKNKKLIETSKKESKVVEKKSVSKGTKLKSSIIKKPVKTATESRSCGRSKGQRITLQEARKTIANMKEKIQKDVVRGNKKKAETGKMSRGRVADKQKTTPAVSSDSDVDVGLESDEDLFGSTDEEESQVGSSAKAKGSKGKKYKTEEMKQLLSMCFKYYSIIEGNISNAEGGLTKAKKEQTWQMITDQLNRLEIFVVHSVVTEAID